TWAQLGQHEKPVLLANIEGFWQPLIDLLEHMRDERFIRNGMEVSGLVASHAEDIVPLLIETCAGRDQDAIDLPAVSPRIRRL
ncbi:MAG: LOG family protein, partial [Alphaproteobacteria bacterium]